MDVKHYMAKVAIDTAADNTRGYTNNYPYNWFWVLPDMDCGSFMSYVLHMAMLKNGIDTGHAYFEPMGSSGIYNEAFLLRYCDKYDYNDVYNEVGDILVSAGHTEMYTAAGQLTGARNDYDGRKGDSSGREICTSAFYNGNWLYIYRLKDKYNIEIDGSGGSGGGLDMSMIPEVKKGDEGNVVLSYQYLLKYKLGYDKTVCDGKFGDQMDYNVKDYQREHDLYVDGVIGPLTGYSMIVNTGYEEP